MRGYDPSRLLHISRQFHIHGELLHAEPCKVGHINETYTASYNQGGTNVRRAIFNRRYRYKLVRGKSFRRYGLEQQCEIVRDYFLVSCRPAAHRSLEHFEDILPFIDKRNA